MEVELTETTKPAATEPMQLQEPPAMTAATPASPAKPKKSRNKLGIFIVFLSVSIDMLGISLILPVLPFLALDFGASAFEVGIIFSAYALAQAISVPISGRLSDVFGRKPLILFSLAGSAVGFLLQGLSNSVLTLVLARAAAGLVGASLPIASAYVADVTTLAERPAYLAALGSVVAASFLFGPSIGAGLAEFDLSTPMFVSSAFAAGAFVLAAFKLNESLPPHRRQPCPCRRQSAAAAAAAAATSASASPDTAAAAAPETDEASRKRSRTSSVVSAASAASDADRSRNTRPLIIGLWLVQFMVMLAFAAFLTMLGIFAEKRYGYGSLEVGFLSSGTSIIFIVTQMLAFPPCYRKFGGHTTAMGGALLFALGLAFVPLPDDVVLMCIALAVMGFGYGLIVPCITSMLSSYASRSQQGSVLGTGAAMEAVARVVAPIIFGILFDEGAAIPFLTASGVALLVFVDLVIIRAMHSRRGLAPIGQVLKGAAAPDTKTRTDSLGAASSPSSGGGAHDTEGDQATLQTDLTDVNPMLALSFDEAAIARLIDTADEETQQLLSSPTEPATDTSADTEAKVSAAEPDAEGESKVTESESKSEGTPPSVDAVVRLGFIALSLLERHSYRRDTALNRESLPQVAAFLDRALSADRSAAFAAAVDAEFEDEEGELDDVMLALGAVNPGTSARR